MDITSMGLRYQKAKNIKGRYYIAEITQILKVIPRQAVIEEWENIFVYMDLRIVFGHAELWLRYIKKPESYMITFSSRRTAWYGPVQTCKMLRHKLNLNGEHHLIEFFVHLQWIATPLCRPCAASIVFLACKRSFTCAKHMKLGPQRITSMPNHFWILADLKKAAMLRAFHFTEPVSTYFCSTQDAAFLVMYWNCKDVFVQMHVQNEGSRKLQDYFVCFQGQAQFMANQPYVSSYVTHSYLSTNPSFWSTLLCPAVTEDGFPSSCLFMHILGLRIKMACWKPWNF